MTDSTEPPYAEPSRDRYTFRVPLAVASAVHVWAAEMGISDNAAWCLLLRAGLVHAISDPAWLPASLGFRDRAAQQVKRNVTLPIRLAALLESWAADQGIYRDVAAAVLLTASLLDAERIGLPHLKLPETITQEAPPVTATTIYGSWAQYVPSGGYDPADYVRTALGDFTADYDLPALEQSFRDSLNARLADGVFLAGDQFHGPVTPADPIAALEGPGFTTRVREAIEDIDFWGLAEQHAKPTEA